MKGKADRGMVGWEIVGDVIRLTVPAKRSSDNKQKRISSGLAPTPENIAKIKLIVEQINNDISTGTFDPWTLRDYLSTTNLTQNVPTEERNPTLDSLCFEFTNYKKSLIKETSLKLLYQKIANKISQLPTSELTNTSLIVDYLITNCTQGVSYITLHMLDSCCDWAVLHEKIKANPFKKFLDKVKAPHSDTDPDPFIRDEMLAIISAYELHPIYSYYAPFVKFLFQTGCRTGEAVALKWSSVTNDTIKFCESITVIRGQFIHTVGTKTVQTRIISITPAVKEILDLIKRQSINIEPNDFVFKQGNSHIKSPTFYKSWYGYKKSTTNKKGLKVCYEYKEIIANLMASGKVDHYRCPYSTRHTYITLAIQKWGKEPDIVNRIAKLVGNSAATIFKHYLGLAANNKEIGNINLEPENTQLALNIANGSEGTPMSGVETLIVRFGEMSAAQTQSQADLKSMLVMLENQTQQILKLQDSNRALQESNHALQESNHAKDVEIITLKTKQAVEVREPLIPTGETSGNQPFQGTKAHKRNATKKTSLPIAAAVEEEVAAVALSSGTTKSPQLIQLSFLEMLEF